MSENISIVQNKCYGCGLCKNICSFDAIKFVEDKEGFLYPKIDEDKCKNCGKCLLLCPANKKNIFDNNEDDYKIKSYMVISKDKVIYDNSASGGFATILSKYVIEKLNGVVYGCTMDDNANVKHIRIERTEELIKLQDSKYVQSNIINSYQELKRDLENRKVLFVGTPCQIESIKIFLNNRYKDNLITCDLVCHGVPSPGMFKKYYNYLSQKYGNIKKYRFRNKSSYDKCGYRGKVELEEENRYFFANEDVFYNDFLKENNFRMSCYHCKYKEEKRVGDFTLGDVNSWELYYDFYPEMSSSLVVLNTQKANDIFHELHNEIIYREISFEKEKKINKALGRQSVCPKERNNIYSKYDNLLESENKLKRDISYKMKFKNIIKVIIPFKYRIFLKKCMNRRKNNE